MDKDDTLSSSQLRQRYQKGGELRDDQLTAAQLRARYGLTFERVFNIRIC